MRPRLRSYVLGGTGVVSALGSALFSRWVLSSVSRGPRGDGFVAGLLVAFGLALGLSALLVGMSGTVLLAGERYAPLRPRQRLVLQVGCGACVVGTLSVGLVSALNDVHSSVAVQASVYLMGSWVALVLFGTALTLLGGLWAVSTAVERRRHSSRTAD